MKIFKSINVIIRTGAALLLCCLILSCSKSSEFVYNRMLDKFSEGKSDDFNALCEKFLLVFSDNSFPDDKLFYNKNLIISVNGKIIEVLYPESMKFSGDESLSENITFADINKDNLLLGNNKGFCIFNRDGESHTIYKSEKDQRIDAVALKNNTAVFLAGGRIYEYMRNDKKPRKMDPGEYNPPYKKFFRASLISSGRFIGLATGIAGSYNISIFDGATGLSKVKNISSSSVEFNINDSSFVYVRGGTGNWMIESYDIPTRKRAQIKTISKMENMFISAEGFIVAYDKKSFAENFKGEKVLLPESWTVLGICRNMVMVEYKNTIYLIDFPVLIEKLLKFNEKTSNRTAYRAFVHGIYGA